MTVFLLIIAVLTITLTGFLFLQIFDNLFKAFNIALIFSLSWLIGVVIISYSSLIVLFGGFWGLSQNILIILLLPFILFMVLSKRIWINIQTFKKNFKIHIDNNNSKKDNLINFIVLLLILFYGFLILLCNIKAPIDFWDGFMIWGLKTKLIFYNMMDLKYFLSKDYFFSQLDYPLLFPLIQAFISKFIGFYDERLNRIIFGINFFSFIFILHYFITRYFKNILSYLIIVPFILIPVILLTWLNSSADTILMTFYLVAIVTIFLYLLTPDQNVKMLIPASVCILGCLMTKNEGVLYILSLMIITVIYSYLFVKNYKANFRVLLLCFAIPFILNLPWIIFVKLNGICNVEGFSLFSVLSLKELNNFSAMKNLLHIIFVENISNTGTWGLTFYIFFIFVIYGLIVKKYKEIIYFASTFFLNLLGVFIVYMHSPHDVTIHAHNSFCRVLISMMPLVICYIIAVSAKDKEITVE